MNAVERNIQQQFEYDAEHQRWIPIGSDAVVDFYGLINPVFLTRLPPPVWQVRDTTLAFRVSDKSSYYVAPIDRCLYAFDIRLNVPPEKGPKLELAEFATLTFGGAEQAACRTELFFLGGQTPQEYIDNNPVNDVSEVEHYGADSVRIRGWGSFEDLPSGFMDDLELDSLVGFDLYLCSRNGRHNFIADETMLNASQSWVITQPYGIPAHLQKEYKRVLHSAAEKA